MVTGQSMAMVVNGASGFVGRALVRELAAAGFSGCAVSRTPQGAAPHGWYWALRDEVLRERLAVDTVVHLEVKQHVVMPDAVDLADFERVNVGGVREWLNWCTRCGILRFVYFSSIKAVQSVAADATFEDAPGNEESPYGTSKWRAEQLVREWVSEDGRRSALILRPAVVYGPGCVGNVAAMLAAIRRHGFFLVGQNRNVKSLVSIRNVTAATRYLAGRMTLGRCEVFNLVDHESFSVREIDAMLRRHLRLRGNSPTIPVSVARLASWLGDRFYRISARTLPINSQRLEALLEYTHFSADKLLLTGFRHPQDTMEGLEEMVRSTSIAGELS